MKQRNDKIHHMSKIFVTLYGGWMLAYGDHLVIYTCIKSGCTPKVNVRY